MIMKRKEGLKAFKFRLSLFFFFLFLFAISITLEGAYLKNVPVKIIQPNGEEIQVFASGDEFYNWLHDKDGFTIIQNPKTGYYVYAIEKDGDLFPSNYAITSDYVVNIAGINYLNITRYLKRSLEKRKKPKELSPEGSPANVDKIRKAPRTGIINNIVIFIRFSDESEFTDSISTYDAMFNDTTAGANSMYNYFKEASYNQLGITTTFYPTATTTVVSYQDSQPRAYYQTYDETTNPIGYQNETERRDREHTLLKNAVDYVTPQIPGSLDVDGDGDGLVDNVCFIIYGSPDGWAELLWPHMWSLYSTYAYINGKRVYTFNFQLQTSLNTSGVGVLCHEMFHSLGAPDLYHYSFDGLYPVYTWGLMEYNSNPPRHMGAYMKYRYGTWISSMPEITSTGTYDLNPLTSSTNNCHKIASPFSITEYFMVEYRRKSGTFENSLPGEGLLVYRINTSKDGLGNRDGPPDEVYIYRPDGTTTVNGVPTSANFSTNVDRTAINDTTNPSSFLSDDSQGGLDISNIGSVNGVISFDVTIFSYPELAEALDNYDLSWLSGGDGEGWYGQTNIYFYDNDAAESRDISDDQSNYLTTTVQGPGELAFYWKVSSEENYDYLTFYVDDEQKYQISGEVDWEQKTYSIGEGSHLIKWEYKKDYSVSSGPDCGWLDKVEYIPPTKTLTLSAGTGGTTDPAPGTHTYDTGTKVSITATPNTNYRFSGWTGDVPSGHENDNPITITMDSDKSIEANFIRQYTLTITAGSGGTTDPSPGTHTYDVGTDVAITATPESGYRFGSWTGDVPSDHENDNPITITMDSDKSIEANFIRQYTLTITAGTGGTTNPSAGSYIDDVGTQVSVRAIPNSGYRFNNWSGDASGTSNLISITMDSDKSIKAKFSAIPAAEEGKKGGCFIATVAYGSSFHSHVRILRDFRDKYLMPSKLGRALVDIYYKYSPSVADFIMKHKVLKAAVRFSLMPVIVFSYSMLHFGLVFTTFMFLFIFLLPIPPILFCLRRMRRVEAKSPKALASLILKGTAGLKECLIKKTNKINLILTNRGYISGKGLFL